ncbi:hypothetical protein RB596_005919 [Gaeumannomyces avenae]
MSWAAYRETSREEDRAYSLLGLFGVNMPILYGEGGEKAYARLQRKIMKQSSDDSIFAWTTLGWERWARVFALPGQELYRDGFTVWRPELFYSGFAVHTAATAEAFRADSNWTSASLAHMSTTYEETKHFLSLSAPILTSSSSLEISKTRIFILHEASVPGPASDGSLRYNELVDTSVESVLSGTTVVAILSCCFEFGRVGIVLERAEDGTYSRAKELSVVGVRITELPQPEVIRI